VRLKPGDAGKSSAAHSEISGDEKKKEAHGGALDA
jgi:hypothetical protein